MKTTIALACFVVGCQPGIGSLQPAQLVNEGGGAAPGPSLPPSQLCKDLTLHGHVFFNDQREYGTFAIRFDQSGASAVQYAVRNGSNSYDHSANFVGMLDATVEIYEVDQGGATSATSFVGLTHAGADGSWTWSGQVCDSNFDDDQYETSAAGKKGVSVAVRLLTRYCPNADLDRCISVRNPGYEWVDPPPAFDDHGQNATTYALWQGSASPTSPRIVYQEGADITLDDAYFQTINDDPIDTYTQAAMQFASLVDVSRAVHDGFGIPWKGDEFGEVIEIFPMSWDGGNGHSHQSSQFCVPAPRAAGLTGKSGDQFPDTWPTDSTAFHEYGHLIMYRAWDLKVGGVWQGYGKWTRLDYLGDESEWDPLEYYAVATKEPWANLVRRAVLNSVTAGNNGTAKVTMNLLGCDRSLGWDNDNDGATFACSAPAPCLDGLRNPDAVEHALCDWFDNNADQSDATVATATWNSDGDLMGGEDLLSMYNAMRDAWDQATQHTRDNYMAATSFDNSNVTQGIHLCDFAAAYLLTHSTKRYALDQTLKLNGIDCDL